MKLFIFFFVCLVSILKNVFGAEDAAQPVVLVEGWWVGLLSTVLGLLGGFFTYVLKLGFDAIASFLAKYIQDAEEKETFTKLIDSLRSGVEHAQVELVRELKADSEDGKLTKDEIAKAEALALAHAKSLMGTETLQLAIKFGEAKLVGFIRQIVHKRLDKDSAK